MMRTNFIIPIILLALSSTCCSIAPPQINQTDEFVLDISNTSDENPVPLVLHCEGEKPIEWLPPSELSMDIFNISTTYNGSRTTPYSSEFKIFKAFVEDTGNYSCLYRDDPSLSDKTYVYVDDGRYDFVIPDNVVIATGTTAHEYVLIDCRVTRPDTKVSLYLNNKEVLDPRFTFNPRVGFILSKPRATDHSRNYECWTPNDRLDSLKPVWVEIKTQSGGGIDTMLELRDPYIIVPSNVHFVVGEPFQLICAVRAEMEVTLIWTKPNNDGPPPKNIPKAVPEKKLEFEVSSAQLSDSGTYECRVSKQGFESKSTTITIHVARRLSVEPFLNVSTITSYYETMAGDSVKWVSVVKSFPGNPYVTYYNPEGNILLTDDRIYYEFEQFDGKVQLVINEVSPNDFGNWTLLVESRDARFSESLTYQIVVKSVPVIKAVTPPYATAGESVSVACRGTGYPLPSSVTWQQAECAVDEPQCDVEGSVADIQPAVLNASHDNIIDVEATLVLNRSSVVKCSTSNKFGEHSDIAVLHVTDLNGLFVLQHDGLGGTQVYSARKKKLSVSSVSVIVNDPVRLSCGITTSLYHSLQFQVPEGIAVTNVMTEYSESSMTSADMAIVTNIHQGLYTCKARSKLDEKVHTIELNVVVKPEEPIQLLDDSTVDVNGKTFYISGGEEYSIKCNAVGAPEPTVEWLKDGAAVVLDDTTVLMEDNRTLHIRFFTPEHSGEYSCVLRQREVVLVAYADVQLKNPMSTATIVIIAISAVLVLILVLVAVYLIRRLQREQAKSKEQERTRRYLFEQGNVKQINSDLTATEQAELLPYDKSYEIERERITFGRQLGSGAFGRVVKAEVTGLSDVDEEGKTHVAVKMCKSAADANQLKDLATELKIMIHLGKHLNIVNLIGACTGGIAKGELWILVEYCKYGDLLSFIQRYKRRFIDQIDPITDTINYKILTLPSRGPLSPGGANRMSENSNGSGAGWGTAPSDQDGYLVPNREPLILSQPPKGRPLSKEPTSPPPQSPGSPTSLFAGNPSYGILESKASNDSQDVFLTNPATPAIVTHSPPPYSASQQQPNYANLSPVSENPTMTPHGYVLRSDSVPTPKGVAGRARRTSSRSAMSDTAGRESCSSRGYSFKQVNTDMTTVSGSYRAMSPDVMLDSQGNPMNIDGTSIPGLSCPFTTTEMVCWAWQIAQGMEYLARRKIMHGDLAARNILLAEGNVIKISDFGMSKDMYRKDIYIKVKDDMMPIKWMSIEAIKSRMLSIQSDVWAYGIVLWEMFSLGQTPYPGMNINPEFVDFLENGNRNKHPKYCNKPIYELMLDCWEAEPEDRPEFTEIKARLGDMLKEDMKANYDLMNESYIRMNEDYFSQKTDYLNMFTQPDFSNLQKAEEDPRYINCGEVSGAGLNAGFGNGQQEAAAGYLTMKSLAGGEDNTSPPNNIIFSPNPHIEDAKFEFHTPDDLPVGSEEEEAGVDHGSDAHAKLLLEAESSKIPNSPVKTTSEEDGENNSLLITDGRSCDPYLPMNKTSPINVSREESEPYVNLKV